MIDLIAQAGPAGSIGPFELLMVIGIVVIYYLPFWRIVSKMGYPGVLSLIVLVPCVNFILLYFLAFTEWPVERRARGTG